MVDRSTVTQIIPRVQRKGPLRRHRAKGDTRAYVRQCAYMSCLVNATARLCKLMVATITEGMSRSILKEPERRLAWSFHSTCVSVRPG